MTVLGDEDGLSPEVQARPNVFGGISSWFELAERAEAPESAIEDCAEERCGGSESTMVGVWSTGDGGRAYVSTLEKTSVGEAQYRTNKQ